MLELFKRALTGQYEASLCMLNDCLQLCPDDHWDGKVARYPFWLVAYHALCFADLYLSPDEKSFQFRDYHPRGWSEFEDEYPSRRFDRDELLTYTAICRQKALVAVAAETRESLEGPSGFARRTFSRGELHIYNIRHIQHHTGQLSACLRRIGEALQDLNAMRWTATGWR